MFILSYAVILWELITKSSPYEEFEWTHEIATFVLSGKRLAMPETSSPLLRDLTERCWTQDPEQRPEFIQIVSTLTPSHLTRDDIVGRGATMTYEGLGGDVSGGESSESVDNVVP